jgi:filamentous hemagglutinin
VLRIIYSLHDMKAKGSFGANKTQRDEVTDIKDVGSAITSVATSSSR